MVREAAVSGTEQSVRSPIHSVRHQREASRCVLVLSGRIVLLRRARAARRPRSPPRSPSRYPRSGLTPAAAAGPPKFPGAAWTTQLGPTHLSSPVIADVNGDGHPDVVTADLSGMLHVLDGRTGRDLPGWPQPVQVDPGPDGRGRVEPDRRRSRQQRPQGDHRRRGHDRHPRPAGRCRRVQRERLGALADPDADGRGPERRRRHARGRRRERRRLPRRRVRQLRPPHLRGRTASAQALPGLPDRQPRHDLGLARAVRRSAHRPDGHLPRRRREPGRSVRKLDAGGHPARDSRDVVGPADPVVALPASDLPVEPGDREHQQRRPHGPRGRHRHRSVGRRGRDQLAERVPPRQRLAGCRVGRCCSTARSSARR